MKETVETDQRRTRYLVAARTLKPLEQGQLDGLCGLYAIVNAMRLVLSPTRPLTQVEAEAVFGCGVNVLEAHGQLALATIWGVRQSIWKRLIAAMSREATQITRVAVQPCWPLRRLHCVSRTQLFAVIEGAIDRQQPVLVGVSGMLNHYTVICGYSPARLSLFDSVRHHWLSRACCGLSKDGWHQRHQIGASSLVVLDVP